MRLEKYKDTLVGLFTLTDRNPELLKAQYKANINQIPLMYCLVTVGTWGLASSFIGKAPDYLSLYVPTLLTFFCIVRSISWWRLRSFNASGREALKTLQSTYRVSGIASCAFVVWALLLVPYANAESRGQISFYLGLTAIGCMICLMHIRSAAMRMAVVATGGFICLIWQTGGAPVFIAEALNVGFVCLSMMVILGTNFRDFRDLTQSRRRLLTQQRELLRREAVTRRLSEETTRLAYVDSLTDLPNRRHFFEELEQKMEQADKMQPDGSLVVGLLDLDGFKGVNDVYGHAGGDRLLKQVAEGLKTLQGKNIFLARLGGDEFGLILEGSYSDKDLMAIGETIRAGIAASRQGNEAAALVSGSIGFVRWIDMSMTAEGLYERADYALYLVKRSGKGNVEIFSEEHELDVQRARFLELCLRSDSIENEMQVAFQPIVDTRAGKVVAFEALARWHSVSFGTIAPMTFIPIAERIGLIDKLTFLLFQKALAQLKTWPESIRLSFNLSPKSMSSVEVIDQLIDMIRENGIDPARIDLEITETAMMGDFKTVESGIRRLKKEGICIALDDFGTGYSSLVHLHRLPLDKIKIDKSFLTDIATDTTSFTIVKSLLTLGRQLEVGCVVEGVENQEILEIVQKLGGRLAQGYHFARPMMADKVHDYLRERGEMPTEERRFA